MRNIDPTYLYQLMMQRLTGIISQEDDRQLEQLIQDDPAVKALWEKMQRDHPKERVEARFRDYDNDWMDASAITSRPQQKTGGVFRIVSRVAAAVAVVAGIGIGIYFLTNNKEAIREPIADSKPASRQNKAIMLTLAGGEVIDLSQQQDSISVAGARLANANRTLSYTIYTDRNDPGSGGGINSLTVPIGLDYHVMLADGSEVWLNSATNLRFPFRFTGNRREISVNGEAYLKVAKDASRPFLVHTPNGTVQVLGTEFNINSYDSLTVKVALVEGAVRFSAAGDKVSLKPGKEAVYSVNTGIQVQNFDKEAVLGWRKGHYYFYEATLPEITAMLPRWFGVSVKMDNPALRKEQFTGVMNRNVPITVFLESIKFTMNIDYYFDQDSVLHFK